MKFLEWSIALALGVGCLALNSLFTMFPHEVSFQNIVLSLSPIVLTSCLYLIYLKGSKDEQVAWELRQEAWLRWEWELRKKEAWLREEAEKKDQYYFIGPNLRKKTMYDDVEYDDVEVFNEREWIQVSTLLDVLDCFKR